VSRLPFATQLNAHKVSGSGFNVQRRLLPQALSMIEEELFSFGEKYQIVNNNLKPIGSRVQRFWVQRSMKDLNPSTLNGER
jgi:hypothetical protein